jgi:hypothetical protein
MDGVLSNPDVGRAVALWVAISPTDAGTLDCLSGETVTESDAIQVPEARATEECGVETVVLCSLVQVPDVCTCEAFGR